MNATFLFPLLVRTHPFTTTSVSTRPERSSSATIVLFTSDIALILYSLRYFFQTKRKYRHFFPILTQERRHKWAGKPQKTSLYRTDDTIALSVPYKSNIFVSVRTRVPHHALTGHAYGRLQETDRRRAQQTAGTGLHGRGLGFDRCNDGLHARHGTRLRFPRNGSHRHGRPSAQRRAPVGMRHRRRRYGGRHFGGGGHGAQQASAAAFPQRR